MKTGGRSRPLLRVRGGLVVVAAATAMLAAALSGPVAWATTAKPDLVVLSVSPPPQLVDPGMTFPVTVKVKNAGSAAAGRSTVGFFLSKDKLRGSDLPLSGKASVGRLRPGRTATVSAQVTIPKRTRHGDYHVLACADIARRVAESREVNNCRASSARLHVLGTSSYALIDKAVKAGTITEETALTDKVFASFGDSRLPSIYKGDDKGVIDSTILGQVRDEWSSLSAVTQAKLLPFFQLPMYQGSWMEPAAAPSAAPAARSSAGTVTATGPTPPCDKNVPTTDWAFVERSHVKVWWQKRYPGDHDRARAVADAIQKVIWPKLTGLMHKAPLLDGGSTIGCRGGDDRLDVVLALNGDAASYAQDYPNPGCKATPSYIVLNRGESRDTWAHEFMHAITWTYNVHAGCMNSAPPGGYLWWVEASAEWAVDYVYPGDQEEHTSALAFLMDPQKSLDTWLEGRLFQYGAYLFPFYLAGPRRAGASIVPAIWEATRTYDSAVAAIDHTVPGGFDKVWRRFTLYNWNKKPVDIYRRWDGLPYGAKVEAEPAYGAGNFFVDPLKVAHLAAHHVDFKNFAQGIRSGTFFNTFEGVGTGAATMALVKFKGKAWQQKDWTNTSKWDFCEPLQELVVVFSNASLSQSSVLQPSQSPSLSLRRTECQQRWAGTFSGSLDTASGQIHAEWSGNASYVLDGPGSSVAFFHIVGGSASATVSDSQCGSGSHTFDLTPPDYVTTFEGGAGNVEIRFDTGNYKVLAGHSDPSVLVCDYDYSLPWFLDTGSRPFANGQTTLAGTRNYTNSEGTTFHYEWNLTATTGPS